MTAFEVVAWLFAIALGPAAFIATERLRVEPRTKIAVRAGAVVWSTAALLIPIGAMVRCMLLSVTGQ